MDIDSVENKTTSNRLQYCKWHTSLSSSSRRKPTSFGESFNNPWEISLSLDDSVSYSLHKKNDKLDGSNHPPVS